jgi:hypothetical protein
MRSDAEGLVARPCAVSRTLSDPLGLRTALTQRRPPTRRSRELKRGAVFQSRWAGWRRRATGLWGGSSVAAADRTYVVVTAALGRPRLENGSSLGWISRSMSLYAGLTLSIGRRFFDVARWSLTTITRSRVSLARSTHEVRLPANVETVVFDYRRRDIDVRFARGASSEQETVRHAFAAMFIRKKRRYRICPGVRVPSPTHARRRSAGIRRRAPAGRSPRRAADRDHAAAHRRPQA